MKENTDKQEKKQKQKRYFTFMQRKVWGYERDNQKQKIDEGQTIKWSKDKGQHDKQWSTKHYSEN